MSGEDISTNEILIHEVGLVAREKEFEVKEIKTEIAESRTRLAIQCEHHERQILELENSLTDSKSAVASIQIEIDSLDDAELKSTIGKNLL